MTPLKLVLQYGNNTKVSCISLPFLVFSLPCSAFTFGNNISFETLAFHCFPTCLRG